MIDCDRPSWAAPCARRCRAWVWVWGRAPRPRVAPSAGLARAGALPAHIRTTPHRQITTKNVTDDNDDDDYDDGDDDANDGHNNGDDGEWGGRRGEGGEEAIAADDDDGDDDDDDYDKGGMKEGQRGSSRGGGGGGEGGMKEEWEEEETKVAAADDDTAPGSATSGRLWAPYSVVSPHGSCGILIAPFSRIPHAARLFSGSSPHLASAPPELVLHLSPLCGLFSLQFRQASLVSWEKHRTQRQLASPALADTLVNHGPLSFNLNAGNAGAISEIEDLSKVSSVLNILK